MIFVKHSTLNCAKGALRNMSVTLNKQIESLVFTSQIPDIDLTTSDDNEAVVSIVSGGATVFSATHIPYQMK